MTEAEKRMGDDGLAPAETADRETIARLADDVLPKLIDRLTASELGELEVREGGWRIRLRRGREADAADGAGVAAANRSTASGRTRHDPGTAADRTGSDKARLRSSARPPTERGLMTSPGVGYFVARDSLKVGSTLRSGDVVGHVDVLGVRQEVVSPTDGVLRSIDVEQGQAVEYGQPIARVESRVEANVQ